MAEIVVHRCIVRIVRRGGWAWGAEPRQLLAGAMRELPRLIAAKLAALWPEGDHDIASPVQLRIALRPGDLADIAREAADEAHGAHHGANALGSRVEQAVAALVARHAGHDVVPAASEFTSLSASAAMDAEGFGERSGGAAILRVLLAWRAEGVLAVRLSAFSEEALRAWHDALLGVDAVHRDAWSARSVPGNALAVRDARSVDSDTRGEAPLRPTPRARAADARDERAHCESALHDFARSVGVTTLPLPQLPRALVRRMLVAVEATAMRLRAPAARVREIVDTHIALPVEPDAHTAIGIHVSSSSRAAPARGGALDVDVAASRVPPSRLAHARVADASAASLGTPQARPLPSARRAGIPREPRSTHSNSQPRPLRPAPRPGGALDVHVACALPFLLLRPLARVGYLDAVDAALEAAGLGHEVSAFAAALARKVLDPPERGWLRRPEAIANAAAFAGVEVAQIDERIDALARRVEPHLSPLDALIGGALVSGHRAGVPVLVHKARGGANEGFLLVDTEGLFNVAWSSALPRLFPHLADLGASLVLVPRDSVDPSVLRALDDAGFGFVTDATPGRHEPWRRVVRLPGASAWSNRDGARADVVAAAGMLQQVAEASAMVWHALALERRAGPATTASTLEVSLALAASLALGTLAWTLWRERESVTPLLALERFRDLDAHVRFTTDCVSVRLPLGKRYRDLFDHGCLADVEGVPWFAGRVLRFSGG